MIAYLADVACPKYTPLTGVASLFYVALPRGRNLYKPLFSHDRNSLSGVAFRKGRCVALPIDRALYKPCT